MLAEPREGPQRCWGGGWERPSLGLLCARAVLACFSFLRACLVAPASSSSGWFSPLSSKNKEVGNFGPE